MPANSPNHTQTAIGRVRAAAAAGERVPLGWGLDQDGRPTDDPRAILASGGCPLGGCSRVPTQWVVASICPAPGPGPTPSAPPPGSGLAFMIDLLTAGLADGLLCYEQGIRPEGTRVG